MGNVKRDPDESSSSEEEPLRRKSPAKRPSTSDEPKSKKRRTSKASANEREIEKNENDEEFITLDKLRRVTVREFKGKTLVDIREYYTDKNTGKNMPGKKGISLSLEQWDVLKANFGLLDDMISSM